VGLEHVRVDHLGRTIEPSCARPSHGISFGGWPFPSIVATVSPFAFATKRRQRATSVTSGRKRATAPEANCESHGRDTQASIEVRDSAWNGATRSGPLRMRTSARAARVEPGSLVRVEVDLELRPLELEVDAILAFDRQAAEDRAFLARGDRVAAVRRGGFRRGRRRGAGAGTGVADASGDGTPGFLAGSACGIGFFAAAGFFVVVVVAASAEPASATPRSNAVVRTSRVVMSAGLLEPEVEGDRPPLLAGPAAGQRSKTPAPERGARALVEVLEARGALHQHVLLHRAVGPHDEVERDEPSTMSCFAQSG
jgi:hypothetical protein